MAIEDKQKPSKSFINDSFFKSLDNMRAIACFAVILLHAAIITSPETWWAHNFYGALPRFAVPFFFMISGALLINKSYQLNVFLKKRLIRLVCPLIFWSIVYYIWLAKEYASIHDFLITFFKFPIYYHLWFLYSMIGVCFTAIILIPFYNNSSKNEKTFFIALWVLTSLIYPTISGIYDTNDNILEIYNMYMFFGMSGWFFLGAYARDYLSDLRTSKIHIISLLIISFLAMVIFTWWDSKRIAHNDVLFNVSELFRGLHSPITLVYTLCLFILMSHSRSNSIMKLIADNTLGIYCIHLIILNLTWKIDIVSTLSKWLSIPLISIITFSLCLLVIYTLRKIKPLRNFM